MKLGVLVSGDLGFTVLKSIVNSYKIIFVFTDKNSNVISNYCNHKNIPCFVGNPRNNKSSSFVSNKNIDILISINYLFIINNNLINHPKILAFNIHGSLLPKYRGRTPHVWAIINGEKKTGITAHVIDNTCDTGDIIYQEEIIIKKSYIGADILKIFELRYPKITLKVLRDISKNSINRLKQNEKKASYFPKRSPEDGKINLNLKSKRIYDWVRAQSFPYPGSFMFYKANKIIIDQVKIINIKYDKGLKNGTIINVNPLMIKVEDGVLELSKIRNYSKAFQKNTIFT